jgi:hypothetical protein
VNALELKHRMHGTAGSPPNARKFMCRGAHGVALPTICGRPVMTFMSLMFIRGRLGGDTDLRDSRAL